MPLIIILWKETIVVMFKVLSYSGAPNWSFRYKLSVPKALNPLRFSKDLETHAK